MFKNYLSYLCGTKENTGSEIDMIALWTIALVLATLLLWDVARKQLTGISKTTKAELVKKFSDDFFRESTRNIIMLLDFNALFYEEKNIEYEYIFTTECFPYFKIDIKCIDQFSISSKHKEYFSDKEVYTSYEIDDYLLGSFEDIGLFERQGFLNIEDISNYFGWYIKTTWENDEIRKYVSRQRQTESEMIYKNVEYIYKKCISYENCIAKNKCFLWWRVKAYFNSHN